MSTSVLKLLSPSLGLAVLTLAASDDQFIPFDCHQPSSRSYGNPTGNLISDKNIISGLDIQNHKLVQIAGCQDNNTKTLSGLTTSWAKWENGDQTDLVRLNVIGSMESLYEYDHNLPL